MNYFIAINCSEQSNYLKSLQYDINVPTKTNYVKEFHLTLKFLGSISSLNLEEVKRILKDLKFDSFKITLSHIGEFVFGDERRIVWVSVKEKELLKDLTDEIDFLLFPSFKKNTRFFPHITLLRIKNKTSLFKWNLFDSSNNNKFVNSKLIEERSIKVDKIELWKSEMINSERKYTLIKSVNLN